MKKELVFSGVQPTGNLHLGNYLGALKNFVSLQKSKNCLYCVVDLHAITTFQNPKELNSNILETTAGFLASGLDPNKSIIFNQSSVSGHAELAWILNCVCRVGWLNRMTQFKDKAGKDVHERLYEEGKKSQLDKHNILADQMHRTMALEYRPWEIRRENNQARQRQDRDKTQRQENTTKNNNKMGTT